MLLRGDDDAVAAEHPLLANFDAAKVTRLQVSSTSSKNPPLDVVKKDGNWVLASQFDYPVEASKVTDVLTPLAKMAAASPIATAASRHTQLHVADAENERKLVITADGKPITLYIGTPAGSRRTAVRIDGDDRVYAVSGVSAYTSGTEPAQWVDTKYVNIARDQVGKVTIDQGTHRVELSRTAASAPWTASLDNQPITLAAGETLDTSAIDSIVSAATTIDLKSPADPNRDASHPTATFSIEQLATGPASTAPTIIDVIADGGGYWVKQRGSNRAVMVDKSRIDPALGVERAKLVKAPPAAGTGSGSAASATPPGQLPPGVQLPPGMQMPPGAQAPMQRPPGMPPNMAMPSSPPPASGPTKATPPASAPKAAQPASAPTKAASPAAKTTPTSQAPPPPATH
jgi:hypothetical protein